jgi:hypothetical protein
MLAARGDARRLTVITPVAMRRQGSGELFSNCYPWAKPARRDENLPEGAVLEGDIQSCQEQEPVNCLLGVSRRTGRCCASL